MAKVSLSGMTVEALMDLRKRVDEMLLERRAEIETQLERIGAIAVVVRGGGSVLKGKKVPPKYRGPSAQSSCVLPCSYRHNNQISVVPGLLKG